MNTIKVGIFFGGRSREREISFAGGRTVYDNLDKTLFEGIPLFVDSFGKITLLNWPSIYKGTIRDFFPGSKVNDGSRPWQVYSDSLNQLPENEYTALQHEVGRPVKLEELPGLIDFGFLTLHGPYGEDGSIQGILDWLGIPYSGSGIFPSAFGISKVRQRRLLSELGFESPLHEVISRNQVLQPAGIENVFNRVKEKVGFPCVIKAPHQGSSIGVSVVDREDMSLLEKAVMKSLFLQKVEKSFWTDLSPESKVVWINQLIDVREGSGFPLAVYVDQLQGVTATIHTPDALMELLDSDGWAYLVLEPLDSENEVLIEAFIPGKEFSCIVIEDMEGKPFALPPTEIIKFTNLFDYRAKYLPGISRKVTPIDIPTAHLEAIRAACEKMYEVIGFQVYARLDGFVKPDGTVILNDPNTTSGMMPSSFFFHQSAEIGLNPSQFLTYIIYSSIRCRMAEGKNRAQKAQLLQRLEKLLEGNTSGDAKKTRVGVVMGGYSTERHISMESGRNIFEKLSSSATYIPIPIFLTGSDANYRLYRLPIKMMLKDNADDVKHLVENPKPTHPFIAETIERAKTITRKFAANAIFDSEEVKLESLKDRVDEVFIALHGRPGEDGSLQRHLEKWIIPYNGSGVKSSSITINKYETNAWLRQNGILVAGHRMVYKEDWLANKEALIQAIEEAFPYPFIAKPADDGCSSAVKKIKTMAELVAFSEMMFRSGEEKPTALSEVLGLKANEEFPQKQGYLIETLIERGDAVHFLEITGGMLTRKNPDGTRIYEVFEPSEALASGEVLSLEEKFLAGEGQNITPARFSKAVDEQKRISYEVRQVLQRTAELLDVEGYCRIDAFVRVYADGRVETLIIEINSLPGMTPATCIFHQAAIDGLKPFEFIDSILQYGKARVAS